jgi:hypothetical protein
MINVCKMSSMDEIFIRCKSACQIHWVVPIEFKQGLAITPMLRWDDEFSAETYVITHVRTGLQVCGYFTVDEAREVLDAIVPLVPDWNEIAEGNAALKDKVKEIVARYDT